MRLLFIFFQICLAGLYQLIVPFLAETSDERSFEKLVEADAFFPSQHFGSLADFPLVVVDGSERWIFGKPYRIEVAGDGLVEIRPAFAVGFFDGAIAHSTFAVAGKHTVFTVDDGCYQVAFFVNVSDTPFFNLLFSLRQEVIPYHRQNLFQLLVFFFCDRRAGITFDAAFSETFVEIAAEKTFNQVEADKYVSDL